MEIFDDLNAWKKWRKGFSKEKSIGFVPTMGCLHKGHAALIDQARNENNCVVLSIYVNPMQFNEQKDLDNYPKTLKADLKLAQELGVDAVILPTDDQVYPDDKTVTVSSNDAWTKIAEGPARPGHFDGVLTVVLKLLILVKAKRAYFGEKDYQQLQLIKKMVAAFLLSVEVVGVETVRDGSGLALSSRNSLLSAEELEIAQKFATEFLKDSHTLQSLKESLLSLPLELDYLVEKKGRWLVAINVGSVRLIDNRQAV